MTPAPPLGQPGAALLLTLTLLTPTAHAQNRALDLSQDRTTDLHPTLREGLSTLGRYAESVDRQVNSSAGNRHGDSPLAARAAHALPAPPAAGGRRFEASNDPFEVSPQLREARSGNRYTGLPGASILELQRQVQLRALIITPQGRAAQLAVKGTETITVMDKELIDLGGLGTFLVHIERDGVTLYNPSMPQGKKVVLR
jgi:hypothetical protein